MDTINKVKSISIWIFIVPFLAVNTCLILITSFHELFPNKAQIIGFTIPYIDGGTSISRTARVFPTYLIFKPAMFLTAYLLIRYWLYIKDIILNIHGEHQNLRKILIFGIGSAISLVIHSIFLGIKFDYDLYKLFRRVIMLVFIIFEVVAQAYLVITLYSIKNKLLSFINLKYLKLKAILVSILVFVMIVSIPIVTMPGNKHIKHALEWDFFLGVIFFYVLTFFMWKKKKLPSNPAST